MNSYSGSALALSVLLVGCVVQPPKVAQSEWDHAVSQLGVHRLFPPREDFQVGDVYLRTRHHLHSTQHHLTGQVKSPPGTRRSGDLWIGSIGNVAAVASAFYSGRPQFPSTSNPAAAHDLGSNLPVSQSEPTGTTDIFQGKDVALPNRLRLVAFPDYALDRYVGGDLGGLIPIQALSALFGLSAERASAVSVSVPVAESYAVPAAAILAAVLRKDGTLDIGRLLNLPDAESAQGILRALSHAPDLRDPAVEGGIAIDIVTEVFYARAIDINTTFSAAAAGRGVAAAKVPAVSPPAVDASAATPPAIADPAYQAGVAAQSKASAVANTIKTPGVTIGIVHASAGGVSVRRTFDRPVAIGWKGIRLWLDNARFALSRVEHVGPLD